MGKQEYVKWCCDWCPTCEMQKSDTGFLPAGWRTVRPLGEHSSVIFYVCSNQCGLTLIKVYRRFWKQFCDERYTARRQMKG